MSELISRREAIKNLALGAGALLAAGTGAGAAAQAPAPAAKPAGDYSKLPHVTASDPVAVTLSYHESAKTVEAAKFPNYKPGQQCSNCLQLGGKDGDPWRPCNLFPGKVVNAGGWCKVYVKKA